MFDHHDSLEDLNKHLPLKDKIVSAHRVITKKFSFVSRIAITLYDTETKVLSTYIDSNVEKKQLKHYKALLDNAPSLMEILEKGRPRVSNKLVVFDKNKKEHTKRIEREGYAASYTMPMFHNGEFIGFFVF